MKLKKVIITAILLIASFILVSCSEKDQVKPTLNVDLGAMFPHLTRKWEKTYKAPE